MKVYVGSNNHPIFPRVTAINRLNATRLHELKKKHARGTCKGTKRQGTV